MKESAYIIRNEKGEPIFALFRINGYWIWTKISLLDEDESVEMLESIKN